MARHARAITDGWQGAHRDGWWYLQRKRPDDTWEDVAGPYRRYDSVVRRWQREMRYAAHAAHKEGES